MIVKMNKYAFLVYHKEYNDFLKTLRNQGVLHIIERQSVADNDELQKFLAQRKRIDTIIRYFKVLNKQAQAKPELAPQIDRIEGLTLLSDIEELLEKKNSLQARLQQIEKDIADMSLWGSFQYAGINRLKQAGYSLTFYTCPVAKFDEKWIDEYNAILINNIQSVVYFITITKGNDIPEIDAERPKMPDRGLVKLEARKQTILEDLKEVQDELIRRACTEYCTLENLDKQIQNAFNYTNAIEQTDAEAGQKLMLLEGWIPEENAPQLQQLLDEDGYYYRKLDIADEDAIPIKLKNNRFSKLFEPITKLFSLPSYGEFDPTPFFAPFFMMFFGFCFGDAGYGLLIILIATILKRKVDAEYKPYLTLFQFFGLSTVIFGTLTGSFFGVELGKLHALSKFKDYFLNRDNLMLLSIIVGLLQIIFGKCVAAAQIVDRKGFKYGIAPIAWIVVIVSAIVALGLPKMGIHLPETLTTVLYGFVGIGLLVAFLYNTPGKNVFLNFGTGLWNTYNIASGLLGDTLSYIRLFAIGLTGGILGGVFNDLAFTMTDGMNIVARSVVIFLILIIGHTINFCLCMISSMVHPLRLTFVEYYKNAEFGGGGKEYKPFKQVK